MNEIKINKKRLMEIAMEPSEETIKHRNLRRQNRALIIAASVIAAKITHALRIKNMSNSDFARQLGVTPANVTRYLSGKANFELKTLVEIEQLLKISLIDRSITQEESISSEVNQEKDIFHFR